MVVHFFFFFFCGKNLKCFSVIFFLVFFLLLFFVFCFAGDKDDDVSDEETEKQLSTDFASFYKAMNYDYVVPAGTGTA